MSHSIKKLLRAAAIRLMREKVGEFELFDEQSDYLWPGEVAFVKKSDSEWLFVLFSPSEKRDDQFTLEIGWSNHARFPRIGMRPSPNPPSRSREDHSEEEYWTRLSQISRGEDYWWKVRNPGEVEGQVDDAIQQFMKWGIPFLEGAHRT